MSVASFFASRFWGSRWGVVDRFHRTPHKGLDVVHGARTPVPVLRSGRVVADLPSSSVGRYIVVEVAPNDYDVYCHVVTRGLKGWLNVGTTLCYLAGWGDAHGSAWSGPHCHVCRSTTRTGWAYWGPQNRNPEPLILTILNGTATGGTGTPIKEDHVTYIAHTAKRWTLIDFLGYQSLTEQAAQEEAKGGVEIRNVDTNTHNRMIQRAQSRRAEFIREVRAGGSADVDEAALAASLAPLLAPHLSGVTDAELEQALAAASAGITTAVTAAIPRTFTAA